MRTLSKKLISLILVLTTVFSLSCPAFAANTVVDNQSKILINGHYYTEDEFNELLQNIQPINTSDESTPTIVPRIVAAIPAWAIGEWLLPIAGAYVTVKVTPTIIKVGNQIIESSSKTFSNILNAIKEKKKEKEQEKKKKDKQKKYEKAKKDKQKKYEKAKKDGKPAEDHSTETGSKLPKKGRPNSSKDLKDSKGVKQRRYYDKNGNADMDIDYRHSGEATHKFPHRHNWVNGVRGPAY